VPIRNAVQLLGILLFTIFWGSVACVLLLVDRSGESVVWVGRNWVRWILALVRVRVEAEGLENVDREHSQILMSNHQSVFDIAAIIHTLPVSFRFVAKRELARIPLFGWALAGSGHILVDRGDRSQAIWSLRRGARKIRDGTNVIVFPEGTRSETGEVRAFKSGGFHLATEAGVPIVPVSVSGTRRITPKRSFHIQGGRVKVRYGKPIPTRVGDACVPHDVLKEQVRAAILEGFDPALQAAATPSA
jgi:1-acyl-sn-glycerol-3-phosphate acyltransferase